MTKNNQRRLGSGKRDTAPRPPPLSPRYLRPPGAAPASRRKGRGRTGPVTSRRGAAWLCTAARAPRRRYCPAAAPARGQGTAGVPGQGDPPARAREGPVMGSSIGPCRLRAAILGGRHLGTPPDPARHLGVTSLPPATWGGPCRAGPALPPGAAHGWGVFKPKRAVSPE